MTTTTPDLDPDVHARMRPIWDAADRDLRRDPHMLIDLAELATRAVADLERKAAATPDRAEREERPIEMLERAPKGPRPVLSPEERAEMRRAAQRARRAARTPEQIAADAARHKALRASRTPEQIEAERARARQKANERYASDPAFRDAALARSKARHAAKRPASAPDLDALIRSGAID